MRTINDVDFCQAQAPYELSFALGCIFEELTMLTEKQYEF